MKKVLIIWFFCLVLAGCVTGYQPLGLTGGYSQMRLTRDTYMVNYRGNGYTTSADLTSLILYRCADLTVKSGYKYFVILKGGQEDHPLVAVSPAQSRTTYYGNSFGNSFGNFQLQNQSGQAVTTYIPRSTSVIHRLQDSVVIKMLNEKGAYKDKAINAVFFLKNNAP